MEQPVETSRRASLRWRLITTVIGILLVTLGVVGFSLYTLLRSQQEQRVTGELARGIDEFRVLATSGVDPETGRPFASTDQLLEVALQRMVPAPSEGVLGFVDGTLRWTGPEGVRLRPEDDAQLVAQLAPLTTGDTSRVGTAVTDVTEYRYMVAPVRIAGDPTVGALVRIVDLGAERRMLTDMVGDYAVIAGVALALASVLVGLAMRRILSPIRLLRETATRITEEDLSQRVPVTGTDEFAALTSTVNQMLDRVESAVTAQRQLLDDVGHELRTPVTVVRGHLELMDPRDPDDVCRTRGIAVDELDRMGRLVNDLITLAKAGQPDFVRIRWTELAPLTDGVLERSRMLGDRRWTMSRVADAEAPLDPERITQAWLQLAQNAVQYSEPGTTIDLGSRIARGEAHLWVRDEGIGIAPADLTTVRSRFGRAPSVVGRVEGTGLGLSIAQSIAHAHGGRLDIDSTVGQGTTVTLAIPLTPTEGNQ